MKLLASIALAGALLVPVGCQPVNAPTPPLAPGYLNQADQTMGQTLAATHAFYARIQTDSAAGKVVLTQAEKTGLNDLGIAINVAQPLYIAYHNGQATQQQAQAAIDAASSKQAAVQALGVK